MWKRGDVKNLRLNFDKSVWIIYIYITNDIYIKSHTYTTWIHVICAYGNPIIIRDSKHPGAYLTPAKMNYNLPRYIQGGAPPSYKLVISPLSMWFDISPTKTIVIGVICTNLAIERGHHLVYIYISRFFPNPHSFSFQRTSPWKIHMGRPFWVAGHLRHRHISRRRHTAWTKKIHQFATNSRIISMCWTLYIHLYHRHWYV